jgi:three-Cys-motif partner protein
MVQKFGSATSTVLKLETVFDYLNFYTNALKNKPSPTSRFQLKYLDAFAGSGAIELSDAEALPLLGGTEDFDQVVEGSARRALQVINPFSHYVFSDVNRKNIMELESLKQEFPDLADRIKITREDANKVVHNFCRDLRPMDRAVVFLDPYGNQVSFETLRVIANTKKIDLWYLFPSWWGVERQISGEGKITEESGRSLDRLFGTFDWRDEVIANKQEVDLFGVRDIPEKIATVDSVTRYMIKRMKTIFGEGVSEKWLPLGRNGQPGYSLIFACANKSDVAKKLAHKVANAVMSRK